MIPVVRPVAAPVAAQPILIPDDDDQLNQAIIQGLYDEEFDNEEALEIIRAVALGVDELVAEIEAPHQELDIFTIDHFIEVIVRTQFPNYNMQPTAFVQHPQNYRAVPPDVDDIQIILCDHHYVVSHQIAGSNDVLVYDSG